MHRPRYTLALAATLAALLAGCAASPWHSSPSGAPTPAVSTAALSTSAATTSASTTVAVNPQGMHEVLGEIQRIGALDLATQEQLLHDLQQVDPSLWPQMIVQFRAQLAYAERARQQANLTASNTTTSNTATSNTATSVAAAPTPSSSAALSPGAAASVQPVSHLAGKGDEQSVVPAVALTSTASSEKSTGKSALSGAAASSAPADGKNTAWKAHLEATIAAKEAQLKTDGKGEGDEVRQAQLRMLYLLAGRRDDALRPIPDASAATQGFWSEQLYGLAAMIDERAAGDEGRRAADARQHLDDALFRLRQRCPLTLRNLAFCKRIQNFGCIEPFEGTEFSPGQPVLLYAEVENLVSQAMSRGHHTALRSSYQIFDGRGQQLTEEQFTMTEEYCRSPRRDYFVSYVLHMPERITPGKYTLKLTVEDLKGHNIAQSSLDFSIQKLR